MCLGIINDQESPSSASFSVGIIIQPQLSREDLGFQLLATTWWPVSSVVSLTVLCQLRIPELFCVSTHQNIYFGSSDHRINIYLFILKTDIIAS